MTIHDHDRQVLQALSLCAPFEARTRLDTIMSMVEMTFAQAEAALERLQMLGLVRSLNRGHWFITREGETVLAQHKEPRHG